MKPLVKSFRLLAVFGLATGSLLAVAILSMHSGQWWTLPIVAIGLAMGVVAIHNEIEDMRDWLTEQEGR